MNLYPLVFSNRVYVYDSDAKLVKVATKKDEYEIVNSASIEKMDDVVVIGIENPKYSAAINTKTREVFLSRISSYWLGFIRDGYPDLRVSSYGIEFFSDGKKVFYSDGVSEIMAGDIAG